MALDLQEQELEQRRRYAEMLRQQGMQPMESRMAGRVAVRNSPLEGLAKMLQSYSGAKELEGVSADRKALLDKRNEMTAAALRGMPMPQTQSTAGAGMTGGLDSQDYQPGAAPGDTRTTQPSMQDYGAWMGQLAQAGPQAVNIGSALMGMQQKQVDTAENRAFRQQESQLAREARAQELQQRMADQRATAQERAAAQRELAQMQIDARREMTQQTNALRADIAAQSRAQGGKPPPGYRFTPEGNLEAIPGGPADIKAGAEGAKAATRQQVLSDQAKNVLNTVDEAIKLTGWNTAGVGGMLAALPMTDARKLSGQLETIKSNLGFDRLQQMRDMSPTGGALGQVAVQELNALRSTVAMLDQLQKPSDVAEALNKIKGHYNRWLTTIGGEAAPSTPAAGASGDWSIVR